MATRRVKNLNEMDLDEAVVHEGMGSISCKRVFDSSFFKSSWHFVDYAVLPPGSSIGRHRHGQNEELYLILEGSGVMQLDDEEFRVRSGSVILNRAGGTHGLRNDSDEAMKIFVVEVGLDA